MGKNSIVDSDYSRRPSDRTMAALWRHRPARVKYSVPRIYYRWQVLKILAITPDVQLLINPALNPNEDVIGVFSIRGRISL